MSDGQVMTADGGVSTSTTQPSSCDGQNAAHVSQACLDAVNRATSGAGESTLSYMLIFVCACYAVFFAALTFRCMAARKRRPVESGAPMTSSGFVQFDVEEPPVSDIQNKVVAELDQQWRKAFIGKVYTILGIQLFATVSISSVMMFYGGADLANWSRREGLWAYYSSLIGTFVALGGTICNRTRSPHNLVWLSAFTLFESYMVGMICTYYAASGMAHLVIEAFAITSVIFIALTLFTMQSKINFDFLGVGLGVALLCLMLWGWMVLFLFPTFAFYQVYALAGTVIFALFVVYDTHVLINRLSYDEYILGAINLYLDFLNLFLFILQLLSGGRRD